MKILKNEKGFTLIELVMIIVILGILAAIAVPKYVDLAADAELSAKKAFTGAIQSSASICLADYAINTNASISSINATTVFSYLNETGGLAHSGTNYTVEINGTTYTWSVATSSDGPVVTSP
jgi:prepilin-type N-terminal cleavage/methylation domain-containing protein